MNNASKRELEWCKLLPKPGAARKRWIKGLNHKEVRRWVFQEKTPLQTQRQMSESIRSIVLNMIKHRVWELLEHIWVVYNSYFTRSRKQRLWAEAVMRGEVQ